MALLDVFTTVYNADTKGLESGNERVKQSTDDIVGGLKDAENQSGKTGSSLQSMLKKAVGWMAVVAATSKTVRGAIDRAADIEQLGIMSRSLKTNIGDLDAFRKAAVVAGGDSGAAVGQLSALFDSMTKASSDWTSSQSNAFRQMGVSVADSNGNMRDTVGVLLDVAGAMEGLEESRALDLAQQLGIKDKATLDMMLKGRQEMEAMLRSQKEQGVVSKESAERAAKFTKAMHSLSMGVAASKDALSDALLPAITWVTEKLGELVKWFNDNKEFVAGFFIGVAAIVTAIYLPAMIAAAAATLAATWPFLLIGAAITAAAVAFALIYDDVMNFIKGNDSLIGQILNKYPAVAKMFERIGEAVRFMSQGIGDGIDKIKGWLGFGDVKVGVDEANAQLDSAAANPLNSVTPEGIRSGRAVSTENNMSVGEIVIQTQATDARGIAGDIGSELQDQLAKLKAESASGVAR